MNPKEAFLNGGKFLAEWIDLTLIEFDVNRNIRMARRLRVSSQREADKLGIVLTSVQRQIIERTDSTVRALRDHTPLEREIGKEEPTWQKEIVAADAFVERFVELRDRVRERRQDLRRKYFGV